MLFFHAGDRVETIKRNLAAPLSLNLYGDYVYWYDIQEKAIRRVSKIDNTDEAIVQTGINSMINLLVFHKSRQRGLYSLAKNQFKYIIVRENSLAISRYASLLV